jgi:hypothetical protein
LELLNANDRDAHWARRKRLAYTLRETTAWLARAQRIPRLDRAHIAATYEPPDRRRRDPANWQPSFKACVDGLVDAGVIPDDDAAHVTGPDPRLGAVCPRGRVVLVITERTASATASVLEAAAPHLHAAGHDRTVALRAALRRHQHKLTDRLGDCCAGCLDDWPCPDTALLEDTHDRR